MDACFNLQSMGSDLEAIEADLITEIGIDGMNMLKKVHNKGSLEKMLCKEGAEDGLTPIQLYGHNQMLAWTRLKKVQESAQATNINGGNVPGHSSIELHTRGEGENKLQLTQSWADRMEAMEEYSSSNGQSKAVTSGVGCSSPSNGAKKSTTVAAATSNTLFNREGSSSTHKNRVYLTKEAAILATLNEEVHRAVHGISFGEDATLNEGVHGEMLLGEDDLRQHQLSPTSPREKAEQRNIETNGCPLMWQNITLNGNSRVEMEERVAEHACKGCSVQDTLLQSENKQGVKNVSDADKLNELVTHGFVVSGTQDGIIKVHGSIKDFKAYNEVLTCDIRQKKPSSSQLNFFGCVLQECEKNTEGFGFSKEAGPCGKKQVVSQTTGDVATTNTNGRSGTATLTNMSLNLNQNMAGTIQFGTLPASALEQSPAPVGSSTNQWVDILGRKSIGKHNLSYIPPSFVNGKPVVHINSQQFSLLHDAFTNAIIGSFIGRRAEYGYVMEIARKTWKNDKFTMKKYGKHSYCFEFSNSNDRRAALEYGSFHIASQLFMVQAWRPFIEANLHKIQTIPVWVVIKDIPEEMRNAKCYSQITSTIGEPLYADKRTEDGERGDSARICVVIDTKCTFPEEVPITIDEALTINIPVEFKWKPPMCHSCNIFGHNDYKCQKEVGSKRTEMKVWRKKDAQDEGKFSNTIEPPHNQLENLQGNEKVVTLYATQRKNVIGEEQEIIQEKEDHGWQQPSKKHTCKARKVEIRHEKGPSERGDPLVRDIEGKDPSGIT